MKLAVEKREAGKKIGQLRRDGIIPAVLYGKGQSGQSLSVKKEDFLALIRNMKAGHLATTVFELQGDDKASHRTIVKEVQYHPVSYEIEHIDFSAISDDTPVRVKVPVHLDGVIDCAGVKLGGTIRQVVRKIEVSCLPKDIPQEFVLDVRDLSLGQTKTLADLQLPSSVKALTKDKAQVLVLVGKKAGAA